MLNHLILCGLALMLCAGGFSQTAAAHSGETNAKALSDAQKQAIAHQIYLNETGGKPEKLLSWNSGENFLSLGIGHFIWFPDGLNSPFTETFPDLLNYFKSQGVDLPKWLDANRNCPWKTQAEFSLALQGEQGSDKLKELRSLINGTFALQLEFILKRKRAALPKMLALVPDKEASAQIQNRFNRLAQSEKGLYALIDYVNFKGEGISPKERYAGEGWGLLQVLQSMQVDALGLHPSFTQACIDVLTQRIQNSPQQEVEQRWLAGWTKRCQTYS